MDRGNFGQRLQHFPKILPGYSLAERLPVSFNWTKRTQQVQFMETKIRHPYLLLTYSHRANEDSSGTLTGTKIVFPVVCCFIRLGACFRTRRNFYLLLYSEEREMKRNSCQHCRKIYLFALTYDIHGLIWSTGKIKERKCHSLNPVSYN